MASRRNTLAAVGITAAEQLKRSRNGTWATVAGHVIVRQRPGTAKGVIFLSLEDETGNANVIVSPQFYDENRMVVVRDPVGPHFRYGSKPGKRSASHGAKHSASGHQRGYDAFA
jgi:DNA polymerase III alpha subunit